MREYGTISAKFWIGETGKKLRGDCNAQLLAVYLMTSPHASMSGLYYCPIMYMVQDTGIPFEGASKGLRRLIEEAFCEYDNDAEMVFVRNMAKHQIGQSLSQNDKRRTGLLKELSKFPRTRLLYSFVRVYSDAYLLKAEDLGLEKVSPSEGAPKPLRSQDQDQDQDPDQEQELGPGRKASQPRRQKADERGRDLAPPSGASERLVEIYRAMQNEKFNVPGIGGQTMWENITKPRELAEKLDSGAPGVDVPVLIRTLAGWTYAKPKQAKKALGAFVWNNAQREQDRAKRSGQSGGGDNYTHGADLAEKVARARRGDD